MSGFKNLKIGVRLAIGFAAVLLLTILIGLGAISRLGVINDGTKDVATNWLPATRLLGEYRAAVNIIRQAEAQHVMSTTGEQFSKWEARIEEGKALAAQAWDEYLATVETDDERALVKDIVEAQG
ncbi:MAG TPA: MCP four helix bundle domain-containing protein, partial [Burkholderiaceae bacterium]